MLHRSMGRPSWKALLNNVGQAMPDGYQMGRAGPTTSLVLAGGVSLGGYEAGAYAALHDGGVRGFSGLV